MRKTQQTEIYFIATSDIHITTNLLVDLHLRTKADLYSFMQGSFVKIQDLIGYVSKYMLNAT